MVLPLTAVFLLLLVGAASTGVVYTRNSDGSFSVVPNNGQAESESLLDASPNFDLGNELPQVVSPAIDKDPRSVSGTEEHIVKFPLDDEDLELIQEFLEDTKINKTGQLRYSSLATVQTALVKDIVRIILKDEEYKLLLNNPSFPDVVNMVKDMLKKPTQEVLQQQISNKVLAVQAYYSKFYKPLNNPDTKEDALAFLKHLRAATVSRNLTVEDTVELNEKMQRLAFLMQETPFNMEVNELEKSFEHGANLKRESEHSSRSKFQRKAASESSTSTSATPKTISGNNSVGCILRAPIVDHPFIYIPNNSTETPVTTSKSITVSLPVTEKRNLTDQRS